MSSILNDVKKVLGIAEDYLAFDTDILMHINSTFAVLNQMGVGPKIGFTVIDENDEWDELVVEQHDSFKNSANMLRSYTYAKVRMLFDSPDSANARDSLQQMVNEYEWRLMVAWDSERDRTETTP